MFSLSEYGDFPNRFQDYEIVFDVDHVKSDDLLASLRIVPYGYECDEKGIYGVYVYGCLEQGDALRYPTGGDFIHPSQFRDLRSLIANGNHTTKPVRMSGEIYEFEFRWQEDDRLRLTASVGTEGWGKSYVERLFSTYPFRTDLKFAFSVSRGALKPTLDALTDLLELLDKVEFTPPAPRNRCGVRRAD